MLRAWLPQSPRETRIRNLEIPYISTGFIVFPTQTLLIRKYLEVGSNLKPGQNVKRLYSQGKTAHSGRKFCCDNVAPSLSMRTL